MKTYLLLLAAAYVNGGAYVDAGATVAIGDEKNEITEERAEEIVRQRRAELVEVPHEDGDGEGEGEGATPPAPAPAKPAARRR